MSVSDALKRVRAHDPAADLAPLSGAQRDALRQTIVSTPLETSDVGRRRRAPSRKSLVLVVAVVAMLGVVGGGIAGSGLFKSPAQENQGLPDGSTIFIGTHPACTTVNEEQFHCVLQSKPTVETLDSYLGSKMQTVDATKHVDGGCVGRSQDGLVWDCYLGQAAVDQGILAASLLGEYQSGPASG
jgi:hypothetical protein